MAGAGVEEQAKAFCFYEAKQGVAELYQHILPHEVPNVLTAQRGALGPGDNVTSFMLHEAIGVVLSYAHDRQYERVLPL